MSTADMASIKAELKTWERQFRTQHGREPGKADIKADANIAEKYRLYSKTRTEPQRASKQQQAAVNPTTMDRPSVEATTTPRKAKPVKYDGNDMFKTPSKRDASSSSSSKRESAPVNGSATEYAFAPSPSRLRALAASRSFSGSPNTKSTRADAEGRMETHPNGITQSPRNLGRSFVLPPDTPRTKALKWLSGDAVSPPVKARPAPAFKPSNSGAANGHSLYGKSKDEDGMTSSFWAQVKAEGSKQSSVEADSVLKHCENGNGLDSGDMQDDEDFLAPSPVKPSTKIGGKGKQRQIIDLLGDDRFEKAVADERLGHKAVSVFSGLTRSDVNGSQQSGGSKRTSDRLEQIFKPSSEHIKEVAEASSAKVTAGGLIRPKKRTSAVAALVPIDRLSEAEEIIAAESTAGDSQPVAASSASNGTVSSGKLPNAKRPRKAAKIAEELERSIEEDQEEDLDFAMTIIDSTSSTTPAESEYETFEIDAEYVPYHRVRSAMLAAPTTEQTASDAVDLDDDSLDAHLVSLLSLRTSPVKNRLAKLHKKRDNTVKALLREPTYLLAQKKERERKGLEDLEEDEDLQKQRPRQRKVDVAEEQPAEDDEEQEEREERGAEHSDDDWASEPEGWKDLGDGEMDDMD